MDELSLYSNRITGMLYIRELENHDPLNEECSRYNIELFEALRIINISESNISAYKDIILDLSKEEREMLFK